jgi:hypothetical protein
MKWLLIIVFLVLLAVSAGFRKLAGALVLLCVIGGLLIWQYQVYEENYSRKNILPSELTFEDLSLESSNESYRLTGRIINNSDKYDVRGIQLEITISDCKINANNNCIIITEANEYIYADIPSKQARDFRKNLFLYSDIVIKGKLDWDYSVKYVESK